MSTNRTGFYIFCLFIAALIVVLDQYTKHIAYDALFGRSGIVILPIFRLDLVFNEGAAFGFLGDAGGWQRILFIAIAAIFSIVLLVWIWKEHRKNAWLSVGLAFVLGGAIGNLIDRVAAGYVIDFLVVHYEQWYFPAFNIADIAITVGAIMLIIDTLFFSGDGA
ncbi:MAG: signal peptidase II [Acidiferrobacterales bacterium]|nr:signal peptidase II [Acidiferrobacterales bacterium]